jgi:hypothetical protein
MHKRRFKNKCDSSLASHYGYGKNEYVWRTCGVCGRRTNVKENKRVRQYSMKLTTDDDGNTIPEHIQGQNCPYCGFAY